MTDRTKEIGRLAAAVGSVLAGLDLGEVGGIAALSVHPDLDGVAQVILQLGTRDEVGRGLLAWVEQLRDARVMGQEFDDYLRLSVTGLSDGVAVEVWTHVRGPQLIDAGCVFSLPPDRQAHRVPLGALRQLAEQEAGAHA